ncbi:hypothetical protein [Streptomyces griseosporeus]|uniref:hypothetical protein n=1 Tax=Streptomyces griseosporeus TaxID=1910 RepID=UPI00378CC288
MAALERLGGAKRFEELTGTTASGVPGEFSVRRSVEHLHDAYAKQDECWIIPIGADHPLLTIRFEARDSYPSRQGEPSHMAVQYPVGLFAQVSRKGADLFFRCPSRGATEDGNVEDTPYVKGEMFIHHTVGGDAARDPMVILNSVSRAVAEAAGCASQAGLPAQVPDISSGDG